MFTVDLGTMQSVSSTFSAVGTGIIGLGTVEVGVVACESKGVVKLCKVEWEVVAAALKHLVHTVCACV